jgi:hypothetical protein
VVVFGLFNTCAGHREAEDLGRLHDSGQRSLTPWLALRVVRAAGTDDGDINRYRAYANAVLGRPYQGYYVRPLALWSGDARSEYDAKDVSDPLVTPPVQPHAPLTPYRDFLVEYPPGFFLMALPPAWVGGDFTLYPLIFSLYMGLLLTAAVFAGTRLLPLISPTQETAGALTRWAAAAALALGIIAVRRYDAAVALSLCVLAWGVVGKRPLWAGVALGLGTAAKGLPIFLVPVLLTYWLSRRRFKEAALAAATASAVGLLVALPFVLTAGRSFFDAVSYHAQRPLQIESTEGALLIVARLIAPGSVTVTHTFGSANVIAAWETPLRYLASVLPSFAVIAVCLWTRRRLRAATSESEAGLLLVRALCATLVALMTLVQPAICNLAAAAGGGRLARGRRTRDPLADARGVCVDAVGLSMVLLVGIGLLAPSAFWRGGIAAQRGIDCLGVEAAASATPRRRAAFAADKANSFGDLDDRKGSGFLTQCPARMAVW